MTQFRLEVKDVRAVLELLQDLRGLTLHPVMLRERLLEGVCRLVGAASGSALLTEIEACGERHHILLAVSTPTTPAATALHSAPAAGAAYSVPAALARKAGGDPELLECCLEAARRRLRKYRRVVGSGDAGRTGAARARQLHHCLLSPRLPTGGIQVTGLLLRRDDKQKRPFSVRDRLLVELVHSAVGPLDAPNAAFSGREILDLTPRQNQILHALLSGQSEKQIARELGLSLNTVHHHVKAVYRRSGVSSRGELLAHWLGTRQP